MSLLILERKLGEKVLIGGGLITVTVTQVGPGPRVKLGFDAPRELPIHRAEVQARIDAGEVR